MLTVTKKKMGFLLVLVSISVISVIFFYPPKYTPVSFPDGKDFAFTIFDDTDGSTVENVKPVYDYLYKLGIITTKSVWVLPTNESNISVSPGQTLSDPDYLAFVLELQNRGFEIASHGARDESTERLETYNAIEHFRELIGHYPHTYASHCSTRESLYWGKDRLDFWLLKILYDLFRPRNKNRFVGHIRDSQYFWGDIASSHITYVRNFTFQDINTLKINPSMPYHDSKKPYVNFWFSSSDGHERESFNRLLSKENIDRLEQEGGVCIVYTHFANGFVSDNGALNRTTMERLQYLASMNGYFVPVNKILDYLRQYHKRGQNLSRRERINLNIRWALEKLIHGTS